MIRFWDFEVRSQDVIEKFNDTNDTLDKLQSYDIICHKNNQK